MAIVVGAGASQAPEFAQQYRQRLAGAVDELRVIVEDFDAIATQHGLDREEALAAFQNTQSPFLQARGSSLKATFVRYQRLSSHLAALEAAQPAARPFIILREGDRRLIQGVWAHYRPAVPLGEEGWVYGALGALLGLGGGVAAGGFRGRPRRARLQRGH